MYPLLDRYGDLKADQNFLQLASDVVELVRRNPVEWDGFQVSGEFIAARCRKRTLLSVFEAVMQDYALCKGGDMGWVCKSMQNIRWFSDIEAHFERPLYLYLYRDPRDVVASFRNAVVGDKHPYLIAEKWAELQGLCLTARESASDRFHSIEYEALLAKPREMALGICRFLGLEFSESMLRFYDSPEASKSAKASSLWANVSKPVMRLNSGKYRKQLSPEQILLVEKAAYSPMGALGYTPDSEFSALEKVQINPQLLEQFHLENEALRGRMQASMSERDRKARRFQMELIEKIRSRPALGRTVKTAI